MLRRSTPFALRFLKRAVGVAPDPRKLERGGEDSFFSSDEAIGVADGIGEHYAKRGIDAGEYSRTLTRCGYEYVSDCVSDGSHPLRAVDVIKAGAEGAAAVRGSSTFCVATLVDDVLSLGNIGDSGTIVVRGDEVIAKTAPMVHSLNHPYQLGENSQTQWSDAAVLHIKVAPGDLVVVATDGVLDNLFESQVVKLFWMGSFGLPFPEKLEALVPSAILSGEQPGEDLPVGSRVALTCETLNAQFADALQGRRMPPQTELIRHLTSGQLRRGIDFVIRGAQLNANVGDSITPFGQRCLDEGISHEGGGKVDDATCVIGLVLADSDVYKGRFDTSLDEAPDPYWGYPFDPISPKPLRHPLGYIGAYA